MEVKRECRSRLYDTLYLYKPMVKLHKFLSKCQTKTGTTKNTGMGALYLVKRREDFLELFFRYPDSFISSGTPPSLQFVMA